MGLQSLAGLPTPTIKANDTHLYALVERGRGRVKCRAQKDNKMFPGRAWTRTAQSGDEHSNRKVKVAEGARN